MEDYYITPGRTLSESRYKLLHVKGAVVITDSKQGDYTVAEFPHHIKDCAARARQVLNALNFCDDVRQTGFYQ